MDVTSWDMDLEGIINSKQIVIQRLQKIPKMPLIYSDLV